MSARIEFSIPPSTKKFPFVFTGLCMPENATDTHTTLIKLPLSNTCKLAKLRLVAIILSGIFVSSISISVFSFFINSIGILLPSTLQ